MAETGTRNLELYLERCDLAGAVVSVSGWAFRRDVPVSGMTVVYEARSYSDRVTATCRLLRMDVGAQHGAAAALSGFIANGIVALEAGELAAHVRFADGTVTTSILGDVVAGSDGEAPHFVPRGAKPPATDPTGRFRPSFGNGGLSPSRYAARSLGHFNVRPPITAMPERPVSILASIYQGEEYLPGFFAALRTRTHGHHEIVLVDNGNEDVLAAEIVRRAADVPLCRVVRRDINEGYIRGIATAFDARTVAGHVVVLNSDLELPPGWLPRLVWPLENLDKVATTTPFTNAGTSCSFPLPEVDNDLFLDLDVATIDAAFQVLDPTRMEVELPSGVGFCMAMHAEVIDRIGWFEAETFGFGYGEENDWCMKARRLGWRDLLVPNLFVYHKHGGVYPAARKRELLRQNLEIISQRYPDYFDAVAAYFEADPAAIARAIIAFRLAAAADGRRPRASTVRTGAACHTVMTSLASGDPMALIIEEDHQRSWSAVLSASGCRSNVWGWGAAEMALLCELAGAVPEDPTTRPGRLA